MKNSVRASVFDACRNVLVPIVRFGMRHGLTHSDVSDILKWAFVHVAEKDLDKFASRPTNTKLAEVTGLPRKQVAALRKTTFPSRFNDEATVPSGLVLKRWYNDQAFLTSDGEPRALEIVSDGHELGFSDLAIGVEPNIDPEVLLDELVRSNSVRLVGDEMVEVTSRTFIMSGNEESSIKYFGIAGSNLLTTLNWNTDADHDEPVMFERTALSSDMPSGAFSRFSSIVNETSKPFLELVDDWLASHQLPDDKRNKEHSVVGVGVYVFNRKPNDD